MEQEEINTLRDTPPVHKNKWKIISLFLITLLVISLILNAFFLFNEFKRKSSSISQPSSSSATVSEDAVLFYKISSDERAGIWAYDLEKRTEERLISFSELLKESDKNKQVFTYGNPILSLDRRKIAFFLGPDQEEERGLLEPVRGYDLWVYDLDKGSAKKIISNIDLYGGYTHPPIWLDDSSHLYVSLIRRGQNRLFLVDLSGTQKELAKQYKGEILWPRIVNGNLISFNTKLPENHEVGILDLNSDKVSLFQTPTDSYFSKVVKTSNNRLFRVGGGGLSSAGEVNRQVIYGLEEIDLETKTLDTIPLPEKIALDPSTKRVQPKVFCGEWGLLEAVVEADNVYGEELQNFYRYNLSTGFIDSFSFGGELKYTFLKCDKANSNVVYGYMKDDKFVVFDLSNPSNTKVYDLSKTISEILDNSCLYQNFYSPDNYFKERAIYLTLEHGQSCESFDERAGLYKVNLDQKTMSKISTQKGYEEQDFLITK